MSKRTKAAPANTAPSAAPAADAPVTVAEATTTQEQPAVEAAADPFADVPVTRIGEDVTFDDFSDIVGSDPRKYAAVHAKAVGDRLPTQPGWKHERAMLTPGSSRKEYKPGSVYGTIQALVQAAGRGGIPAYVLATKLRRLQVGNKRSHYCDGLPPVGWAEGWINTAVTKSIAGVHPSKQAPALRTEVTEGEAKANAAEGAIVQKIAANG